MGKYLLGKYLGQYSAAASMTKFLTPFPLNDGFCD